MLKRYVESCEHMKECVEQLAQNKQYVHDQHLTDIRLLLRLHNASVV